MRVNWPRLYLGQELGQGRTSNPLPPMCLAEPVADVRLPRRFPIDDVASHGVVREDGVEDSGLVSHDSGPVRHKGVAVAAGECRHTRRLSIQLMLKKHRQIFLGHFTECNSHLIIPNETELSHRWRPRAWQTSRTVSYNQNVDFTTASAWLGGLTWQPQIISLRIPHQAM